MLRAPGLIKLALLILLILCGTVLLLREDLILNLWDILDRFTKVEDKATKAPQYKCSLSKPCPEGHFAFKMSSGAASVVGPKICLEDNILMSGVKNNVGRGLNIALVNGMTGNLVQTASFDIWAGDVSKLIKFLKAIEDGTLVMMATFDDAATKLNVEARQLINSLGSTSVNLLGFRDNWIFVGGKGLKNKSPFEQHVKNRADTNKYEGWPEVLEMEGCIPQKR